MLDAVDAQREEMTTTLATLVAIPSVSGSDAENVAQRSLGDDLARDGLELDRWPIRLDELRTRPGFPGVEVPRSEGSGLVGRLAGRGGGPVLMLNGHIDVVPPGDLTAWTHDPWSAHVDDGVLYGRGACDMKGGLVAARWAMEALRRSGVPLAGDVLLASVQGEEDGGFGTFALLERGWRAAACVIPEPTSLDIVPANAGALTFRLRVRGRATHASRRLDGVSAVDKLVPVLAALAALERRRNRTADPLFRRWPLPFPLSVGRVVAGDWPSSVPDLLVAEGRLGVALDEDPASARADLERAVAAACAEDTWLREHPVEVEWWGGQFASGRLPTGSDLPERLTRAHRAATDGEPPARWGAPYGSDLRLLAGLGGIPTVQYGPGDAARAHAPDEHVPLGEVQTCARTLALLALDVCGLATHPS